MANDNDEVIRLLDEIKESLERQFEEFREEIRIILHDHSTRMDRQGGFIQNGRRWTANYTRWSERVDWSLEAKNRQIAAILKRLRKLEGGAR
jgi:hypothetical protein